MVFLNIRAWELPPPGVSGDSALCHLRARSRSNAAQSVEAVCGKAGVGFADSVRGAAQQSCFLMFSRDLTLMVSTLFISDS